MRANQFIPEAVIGTHPKRPTREGSRPARGHEAQPRYVEIPEQDVVEGWTQKYKKSINCSHPKGFSQKAHCAGKKKHNESIEMEMVCESCGMCQTHGSLNEIKKGAKDSNGFSKCWPGKHAEGTKKGKNGGQVRNCVPNESVSESMDKEIDDVLSDLEEHGPTSKKLCISNVSDKALGASALASCKSQGLRARDGKKSHLIGHGDSKVRVTVGGKKIKGKAHGGPLPDYGTRKGQ